MIGIGLRWFAMLTIVALLKGGAEARRARSAAAAPGRGLLDVVSALRRVAAIFLSAVLGVLAAQPPAGAAPVVLSSRAQAGAGVEIGSIVTVEGVHAHPLIGYGLVVGLAGTGDTGQATYTLQSIGNLLAKFGIRIPPGTRFDIGNVAAVMVTADLPAFAPQGTQFPVTVSSTGNAKTLQGGVLLQTPLLGHDERVHAMAQGPLSIGGAGAGASGSSVQINHPTVGIMPAGGVVVDPVADALAADGSGQIRLALRSPDYQTAAAVAAAVTADGLGTAAAQDATTVVVVPSAADPGGLAAWLSRVLALRVSPHMAARVVVNERTGTLVAGGDVHLLPAAVAHGSIKVIIKNTTTVSQPGPLSGGTTATVPNAQVSVQQGTSPVVLVGGAATLGDLVAALNTLGVAPRDLIAIIMTLQEAGALQAELVVI
ncbi:MAG: flagellar basal body P-ring protein FlgI [bacterium]